MNIVMIAVHKQGNKVIGYRILDTDTGRIQDVPHDNMCSVIENGQAEVENLKIENGRITGSNGNLQRFPSITNGKLIGTSPLIILFELTNNCYRVSNYMGEIVDITEQEAIKYSETEGIANGKVVPDENGNKHISSINGTYKQDKLILDKQYGGKLVAKRMLLGVRDYNIDDKYYASAGEKTPESLNIGKGILGIADNGFKGCIELKSIKFPATLEYLGENAFLGCKALETIKIPEGIITIPPRCFANCKSLKSICLPNSLRSIEKGAFTGCDKLKYMYCGPLQIQIVFGAIPRGIKKLRNSDYAEQE